VDTVAAKEIASFESMAQHTIDQKFIAVGDDVFPIGFIPLVEVAFLSDGKEVGGKIPRLDLTEWAVFVKGRLEKVDGFLDGRVDSGGRVRLTRFWGGLKRGS
jgi:hypothetical protein